MKGKIIDLNEDTQSLALDLLDYVVEQGKTPVWNQIAAKNFMQSLVNVLKTRDSPNVQLKILYLIKKWGMRFESYKEILPTFSEFYQGLKNANVVFPNSIESDYHIYLGEESQSDNNYQNDFEEVQSESNRKSSLELDLNPQNYDKKYSGIIQKIGVWIENINLTNDMIDNTQVGTQVDDGLKSVVESLRFAEKEIIICIQEKVKNEKLLEILLSVNDDLNKTMTRYDIIRARKRPDPFISNFQQFSNNQTVRKESHFSEYTGSKKDNNDLFDFIGSDNNKKVLSVNKNNVIQNKVEKVDDIFDIFNPKNTENVKVNNNMNSNINSNVNNDPFNFNMQSNNNQRNDNIEIVNFISNNHNPNLIDNPNSINNPNSNLNINNQPEKKGIDLLSEKLKNAYLGKDDNAPKINNQMNMMNNPQIMNQQMLNMMNNPQLMNQQMMNNPQLMNPQLMNPQLMNQQMMNQQRMNQQMMNNQQIPLYNPNLINNPSPYNNLNPNSSMQMNPQNQGGMNTQNNMNYPQFK